MDIESTYDRQMTFSIGSVCEYQATFGEWGGIQVLTQLDNQLTGP